MTETLSTLLGLYCNKCQLILSSQRYKFQTDVLFKSFKSIIIADDRISPTEKYFPNGKKKECKAAPFLNALLPLCYQLPLGRDQEPFLFHPMVHLHQSILSGCVHCCWHCLPHQGYCELLKVSDYVFMHLNTSRAPVPTHNISSIKVC